jgi:hypothetical protein
MAINLNGTTGITTTGLTSNGIDDNATSTAMTLDSSGNVLVGKTTTNSNTVGAGFFPSGNATFCRDGAEVVYVNRKTSDGELIRLAKDGTTVGSIGANGTKMYTGSGATGLHFNRDDASIEPYNPLTISTRDAAIDLGSPDERFKDLYLSGGVYLGGTGSANKLDDVETGTFQTNISAETSGTITIQSTADTLAYTKVGRLVTITGMVSVASTGSAVGTFIQLNNLPFTSADLSEFAGRMGGHVTYNDASAGTKTSIGTLMLESSTQIRLYVTAANVAGSDDFYVSFSYTTT